MAEALAVQGRVLNALILREISARFGHTYFGYVWALLNPSAGVLVLYTIFTFAGRFSPPDMPLLMYVVTGYLTWQAFSSTYDRTQSAISQGQALLHFPQVTGLDILISRAGLEIMTYTVILGLFTAIGALMDPNALPHDPRRALLLFWIAGLYGAAIGTIVGALTPLMRSLNNVLSPILRLGFFTSGIFFTARQLPSWALPYLSWNPMFHVIEGVRQFWFPSYISPLYETSHVAGVLIGGLIIALLAERRSRRWFGR